ncbi:MAG TPA: patatin-like phospholipase family protein [Chthoniobacterales bacterium]|jgi:predicted acylesterase/phospholipase RssA
MSGPGLALCLNSSFLGYYAHAGFLEGFAAICGRPEAIGGASAGGFVAGLYGGGLTPEEIVGVTLSRDLRRSFFEWRGFVRGFHTILNRTGHYGVIRADRVVALMRRHIGDRRIEDCDPHLSLALTNLTAGRSEIVTTGPLAESMVATCAFPILFTAREISGQRYWDGGIANPVPFGHWADDPEIGTIVVHLISHEGETAARGRNGAMNVSHAVSLSHQLVCDELVRTQIDRVERAGKRLIILRTSTPRPSFLRAKTWPALVEMGRQTARESADLLRAVRA